MAVIDELLVGLGFKYDDKGLTAFKKSMQQVNDAVIRAAKFAAVAATAITGLVVASTSASDAQGKLAAEIGDTVENIDALQFALARTGGDAEAMSNSLRSLAIQAGAAARGTGRGLEAFGILGISISNANGELKTASELFLEISDALQGLDNTQQIELSSKLGLRGSIRLLQEGSAGIRELVAEAHTLGVTTAEDTAIAAEFQDSLTDLWRITKQLSRTLTREFAPIMQRILDLFTAWWIANRELIEQQLPVWIGRITTAFKMLAAATAVWLGFKLGAAVVALIALFKSLTVAIVAVNFAALLVPALILSAIAALILLAEDAKVFFEGGDSFLGAMIDKFPKLKTTLENVASTFRVISSLTNNVFEGWNRIFDIFKNATLPGFLNTLRNIPGFLGDITGLSPLESRNNIAPTFSGSSSVSSVSVDTVQITIDGGVDSSETIAEAVFDVFQQTAQDLNSTVDQ